MKIWKVETFRRDNLEGNLIRLSKNNYKIFKIIGEAFDYFLVIAYKDIIPKNQPSALGRPTPIKAGD